MSTAYHAKYFACELTRIGGAGVEGLSRSLFDACVDLNPHQIEAALFAFRSPISKGVLLADEVGLGKTIEAGLVLCQLWAERRRRLLVICPASIRKQWALELAEKFNLPTVILDAKEYRDRQARGVPNPFEADEIVVTSTHFASARASDVRPVQWKDGKPKRMATEEEAERSPRIVKVLRLESYEDTFNNLKVKRTGPQQALDAWLRKQGYSTKDQEFDVIYMNGDNNLENLRKLDQTWKVRLIEEEFRRLMFDVQDV
ncbi:MAG: hypothetical protein HYY65_13480 [Candidatus Tectomicrobia bacterium]|uniref:Helicase ATP-binding domain-containing protein n=1 Tax=Tectimicrobiota bacterium TaxID=2528274 RepID=A0A932GRX1_UNCTE|nr:hypothetical protein [Candidatus Tectomicrobia bacterium]